MESGDFSRRLLDEIRQTSLELHRLLSLSVIDGSYGCDFDSFTDLNPFSASSSTATIASSAGKIEFPVVGVNVPVHNQEIDIWKAESLMQYSLLRSVFGAAEVSACNAVEIASECCKLVTVIKRLLYLLSSEDLARLCDDYARVCEENAIISREVCSRNCIIVNEQLAQSFRTPGKPMYSDLNRTGVFEIVEKICEQAEDERETLETELRNARYDLDRAQESHEVSRKTISYIKTQLESESKRYACLEGSSSEVVSIIRDIAAEFDCSESGLGGLQVAQCLKRQVKDLLTVFPWLRSWRSKERPPVESYGGANPYQILHLKDLELKEKVDKLEATTSFINDLGIELKDLKEERARLRAELECKNLLIRKLREEGAEKSIQIDRYRATFDALFEPNTAANFAKRVAEQYRRYKRKSSFKSTLEPAASTDTMSSEGMSNVPRFGEQNALHYSSCQQSRFEAVPCTTFMPLPKSFPTKMPGHDKENVPDNVESSNLNLTSASLERQISFERGTEQTVAKPLNASPTKTDLKRIRLDEESSKAHSQRDRNDCFRRQTPLQANHPRLLHRNQHHTEPASIARPSSPCPSSFSNEKHDPGCSTT